MKVVYAFITYDERYRTIADIVLFANEKDAQDVYDRKCRNKILGDSQYEVVEMEVIG